MVQLSHQNDIAHADEPLQPTGVNPFFAAGFSLIFHLVAFLLLALIAPRSDGPVPADDQRTVQIVLARNDSRRQDRYIDHIESTEDSQDQTVDAGSATAEGAQSAAQSIPSMDQISRSIPQEFALPTNSPVSNPVNAIAATGLTQGKSPGAKIPSAGDLDKFIAEDQARSKGNQPLGNPVQVQLFGGQPALGRSFLFLIDRSSSMGREGLGALEAAEKELLEALSRLESVHTFQVVAYHHQCVFLHRREMLAATEENKQKVRGFLSNLAAFGATEHEMALYSALSYKPDVIYLLTDGGDPELTEIQILAINRRAGSQTAIHCIQFGFGPRSDSRSFLENLAARNRGGYQYVDVAASLR